MSQQDSSSNFLTIVAVAVAALVTGAVHLFAAGDVGLWEPWETSLATLGRYLATDSTTSPFAIFRDGELISRPWLEAWLLKVGYQIGEGSEFGFRLPFATLNIVSTGYAAYVLARFFGPWRGAGAALLVGLAPYALLSSINLAGGAAYMAPLSVALLSAAWILADGGGKNPSVPFSIFGLALGFCFWGLGVVGFAVATTTIAAAAVGCRETTSSGTTVAGIPDFVWYIVAIACLWVFVILPIGNVWNAGPEAMQALIDASLAPVPTVEDANSGQLFAAAWAQKKHAVGIWIGMGAPIALFFAALPGSRARRLMHPIWAPLALLLAAIVILSPLRALILAGKLAPALEISDVIPAVLYPTFLTERVMPDHVTFDILIRVIAFTAYPTIALAPFGLGYLLKTADPEFEETDDQDNGKRAIKMFLLTWAGVGFAVLGLATTLARHDSYALVLPLVAPVALALGDHRFMKHFFSTNRISHYAAGIAAMLLLLVMSKDVRGNFDTEMGRPGPHVIFELLLTDGTVEFPTHYVFQHITPFVLLWLVVILLIFGRPVETIRLELARLADVRFLAPVGRVAHTFGDWLKQIWDRVTRGARAGDIGLLMLVGAVGLWAVHLVLIDIPDMTNHFSQKALMDSYTEFSDEDEPLFTAGIPDGDNTYYLDEGQIERLDRISDLRQTFCDAEGRVFAVVPMPRLGEAYYHARREMSGDCEPQEFWVIDGRSSRYALVSNQLDAEQGESHQSFLADNVFQSDEALVAWDEEYRSENADVEEIQFLDEPVVVDERLELVATRITPMVLSSGELTIETFWRVTESPRSGYESFIHIDFGGNRVNGDHDVVEGNYPMNYWIPGDIVRDSFTTEINPVEKRGDYVVLFGFFRGDSRLEVSPGPMVYSDNRINLGTITFN